jgi:antitoxin HigA-1
VQAKIANENSERKSRNPARPDLISPGAAHPGPLMDMILAERLGLSLAEAAERMGVSLPALYVVLKLRWRLTPEMALRFGRLTGTEPAPLLRMQAEWDLWRTARRLASELWAIAPSPHRGRPAALTAAQDG